MTEETSEAVRVWHEGHIAFVELRRPPHNYFDAAVLNDIAVELERLSTDDLSRAIVLCSEGKHFCAGANLTGSGKVDDIRGSSEVLYASALRVLAQPLPMVAAVQGAAIGGGLGLALAADFRVAGPAARFAANFSRLGFHPGFALSVTLPRLVGVQHATDLLLSGRTVNADEAVAIGLCDRAADEGAERAIAAEVAAQLAAAAPLAVRSIRATLRQGLVPQFAAAIAHELDEQITLMGTADWREGIRASRDRRSPAFTGH